MTDRTKLTTLQKALNASKPYFGPMYCLAGFGNAAFVLIYPGDQADLVVDYNPACAELYTKAGTYLVGSDVNQMVTSQTGSWQSTASSTPGAH